MSLGDIRDIMEDVERDPLVLEQDWVMAVAIKRKMTQPVILISLI
jgi:hypothetical protein